MTTRRGATDLCGVLAVDKPSGMTSHDVVAAVRHATGERRVGHAGTLDPMATGLLVVLVGGYTRLEPYLSGATKDYDARIAFGTETDTHDAEGAPTATLPVPAELLEDAAARRVLEGFLGPSMQTPPSYSAIKVGGRTAHRVARAGGELELAPRQIDVKEAELRRIDPDARTWDVRFRVTKGTYIRALARDIGRAGGTFAHLTALRRTRSGLLDLEAAHSLEDVRSAADSGELPGLFASALLAVAMPIVEADAADRAAIATGRALPHRLAPRLRPGTAVAVASEGRLLAVYRAGPDLLKPEAVFVQACR